MNKESSGPARINCYRCKHFFVTWDERFPRGCRFFNFKTRELPSVTVQRASGMPCLEFSEKPQSKRQP
jgi:hypothetical protein